MAITQKVTTGPLAITATMATGPSASTSTVAAEPLASAATVVTGASANTSTVATGPLPSTATVMTGPWEGTSTINCKVILPEDYKFVFVNIDKDADIPRMHFTRKMYDETHDVEYHALHRLMRKEYNVLTFCIDEAETKKARTEAIAAKRQALADAEDAKTQVLVV